MISTPNNEAADCRAGQSAATSTDSAEAVSVSSPSIVAQPSLNRNTRNGAGLSPLSACILRLAELGRQRLEREALAMEEVEP